MQTSVCAYHYLKLRTSHLSSGSATFIVMGVMKPECPQLKIYLGNILHYSTHSGYIIAGSVSFQLLYSAASDVKEKLDWQYEHFCNQELVIFLSLRAAGFPKAPAQKTA